MLGKLSFENLFLKSGGEQRAALSRECNVCMYVGYPTQYLKNVWNFLVYDFCVWFSYKFCCILFFLKIGMGILFIHLLEGIYYDITRENRHMGYWLPY